jgi:ethanolamine utilization protein EutN
MRIGEVIGTVTLNKCHPSLTGLSLRLAVPLTLENLAEGTPLGDEPIAVVDQLGAGLGSRIAISESAEAAAPFRPELKPVDAYNAAILDHINLEP